MSKLYLTDRVLSDIDGIERFSVERDLPGFFGPVIALEKGHGTVG